MPFPGARSGLKIFELAGSAERIRRLITGLERDDEDVVLGFVSVAFTGEQFPSRARSSWPLHSWGLWAAVTRIVRVLFVVGLLQRRVRAGGLRLPRVGGRRVRRVVAMGSPLVGLRASPASYRRRRNGSTSNRYEARATRMDTNSQGAPQVRSVTGGKGTDHSTEDVQVD